MAGLGRARVWLSQAANDAAHARYSMEGGFHAQACYAAQQAVENALKALLLHAGVECDRTHSVVGLRRDLAQAGVPIPDDVMSLADAQDLTRVNIETRYPLGDAEEPPHELFGIEQAQRLVAIAEAVVRTVRGVLD